MYGVCPTQISKNVQLILASMEIVKMRIMTTYAFVNLDTVERIVMKVQLKSKWGELISQLVA